MKHLYLKLLLKSNRILDNVGLVSCSLLLNSCYRKLLLSRIKTSGLLEFEMSRLWYTLASVVAYWLYWFASKWLGTVTAAGFKPNFDQYVLFFLMHLFF